MVNVEHLDDIENVDCRWYIEGVGAVSGKDLEKALKTYYRGLYESFRE